MLTKLLNEQDELRTGLEADFRNRLAQALKSEEEKWKAPSGMLIVCYANNVQEEIDKRKKMMDMQRSDFEKLQQSSSNEINTKISKLLAEIYRLKELETMLNSRLLKKIVDLNEKDEQIGLKKQ
jgi:hypothetical protein